MNKILITGHSGFLGRFLVDNLVQNNLIVKLGRSINSDIILDLSTEIPTFNEKFNLVIHCAGLAHTDIGDFQKVNVQGTRNLLLGLKKFSTTHFVFISSVSVYGKIEGSYLTEKSPLLATDEYGLSKIYAESELIKWCKSQNVVCTILRLPLVVGNNPPGNLGKMIVAIRKGYYINIAGGKARKSMVFAEDVAKFIIAASKVGGIFNLTDGEHPSFKQLSSFIAKQVGRNWILNIPFKMALVLAWIGGNLGNNFPLNTRKLNKITSDLTFDDSLAREKFDWNPRPIIPNFKL